MNIDMCWKDLGIPDTSVPAAASLCVRRLRAVVVNVTLQLELDCTHTGPVNSHITANCTER